MAAPTFGLTWNDVGSRRATNYVQNAPPAVMATDSGTGASLTATAGMGDLAQGSARVAVDTKAPLMGFLAGIGILVVIRYFWEVASED